VIERAGDTAKLPFPVHVHMLRHSTGYALAGKGMDTRRLQHYLGHASRKSSPTMEKKAQKTKTL
jgi:site-specific recombinase XerD